MHYKYMQYRLSNKSEHVVNVGFKDHPVVYDITQPHHHKFHLENVLNEISRPTDYHLGTKGNNAYYLVDTLFPLHFSKQESTPMPEEDNAANDFVRHQLAERLAKKYLEHTDSPIIDKISDNFSHNTKDELGISGLHHLSSDPETIMTSVIHNLLNEHRNYAPVGSDLIRYTHNKAKQGDAQELYRSLANFFLQLKNTGVS